MRNIEKDIIKSVKIADNFLLNNRLNKFGWGYSPNNKQVFMEPTVWAILSLIPKNINVQAYLDKIDKLQNSDGGWSNLKGMPSTSVSSLIIWCKKLFSNYNKSLQNGINWLIENQQNDYTWSWCYGSTGYIEPLTYSLLALNSYPKSISNQKLKNISKRIYELQCADGGWTSYVATTLHKNNSSCISTTALAIIALTHLPTNYICKENNDKAFTITFQRISNGSIFTPYSCALTLLALKMSKKLQLCNSSNSLENVLMDTQLGNGSWQNNIFVTALVSYTLKRTYVLDI